MKSAYIGTSGWAYGSWKPDFYPAKLSAEKFLGYYATRLNSVEVNYTFRRFPTEKLLKGWMGTTPPGFKFTVKVHQSVTHLKRLRGAAEVTSKFISSLQPLEKGGKLGALLFQLPPFLKSDVPLLEDFLAELPRQLLAAFEFRHTSWFTEEVFDALHKRNAALCYAESDEFQTPNVQTSDFSYLRLRKSKYSSADIRQRKKMVAELSQRGSLFAYFKHETTPEGALHAEDLLRAVNPD